MKNNYCIFAVGVSFFKMFLIDRHEKVAVGKFSNSDF